MSVLTVENVSYQQGDLLILESLHFAISSGDFVAIIGPNGGGKTTFLRLLMGLIQPTSGSISLCGTSVEKGRTQVGYLPQHFRQANPLFPISVLDTILFSTLRQGLFHRSTKLEIEKAKELLNTLSLSHLESRSIHHLSGGELQRVYLARALMNDPKLLILDEPTCHVDQPTGQHFYELLNTLKSKMAILMVSHDLSAVAKSATRVACLNKTLISHDSGTLSREDVEKTYCCHVDFIAHGLPHRVFGDHQS